MRRRDFISLCGALAVWPRRPRARSASQPKPHGGRRHPSLFVAQGTNDLGGHRPDPIAAVAATLSVGQSKRLVSANGPTLYDVRTNADAPDGLKNFNDPNFPFWTSQAELDAVKGNNGNNMLDYSRPGCRGTDGLVWTAFCGGHASSPVGGGIHSFSVEDACAAIISGGDGGGWVQRQKASRFANSLGTKPAYSPQRRPNDSFYETNVDGVQMFGCNHANDTMMAFANGVLTSGGASGGPPNKSTRGGTYTIGAIITFDDVHWTPVVRRIDTAPNQWSGLAYYNSSGSCFGLDYDPDTDAVYAVFNQARVIRWNNVSSGTPTLRQVGGMNGSVSNGLYGAVLIPDPMVGGNAKMLFQFFNTNNPGFEWGAWTDITNPANNTTTRNFIHGDFNVRPASVIGSPADTQGIEWEWGPRGKVLMYNGGGDIYSITPAAGTTRWTIEKFLTLTGDVPVAANWARLRRLANHPGIYVIVTKPGNVYLARLA